MFLSVLIINLTLIQQLPNISNTEKAISLHLESKTYIK